MTDPLSSKVYITSKQFCKKLYKISFLPDSGGLAIGNYYIYTQNLVIKHLYLLHSLSLSHSDCYDYLELIGYTCKPIIRNHRDIYCFSIKNCKNSFRFTIRTARFRWSNHNKLGDNIIVPTISEYHECNKCGFVQLNCIYGGYSASHHLAILT